MTEDAELCDLWFWNGKLVDALAVVAGDEARWLVERGELLCENTQLPGVSNLLVGDVVYRLRTSRGLESTDPRDKCFEWHLIDPYTGETQGVAWKSDQDD
jgi:hypothetical protein